MTTYDDENMPMAEDRAAGSWHLDEYGFDGLGPEPLSDTFRRIDLGVHGDTLQRGSCPVWAEIDNNPNASAIGVGGQAVYRPTPQRELLSRLD
jgi:hypothetical protein